MSLLANALLAAIAAGQDKPETATPCWNVRKNERFSAVWKWTSTEEDLKEKPAERKTTTETREVEFELRADNDVPSQGGMEVILKKATVSYKADAYELTVSLEPGKEPVDSWKPKKPEDKARVEKEAVGKADWYKKVLKGKYAFEFSAAAVSVSVWVEEGVQTDFLTGATRKMPPGWLQGTGAPSILNPCVYVFSIPAGPVRAGQSWDIEGRTLAGKPVRMRVDSLSKDAVTLSAEASGSKTEDPFKNGKQKTTTAEKFSRKAVFSAAGHLGSCSQTVEWSERKESSDPLWKMTNGTKKSKTTSELTLKKM